MPSPYTSTIIPPQIRDTIKTRRSRARARGGRSISVEAYSRLVSCNLPASLLIYEHLRHVETACNYASRTTPSDAHREAAARAINALRTAFGL